MSESLRSLFTGSSRKITNKDKEDFIEFHEEMESNYRPPSGSIEESERVFLDQASE